MGSGSSVAAQESSLSPDSVPEDSSHPQSAASSRTRERAQDSDLPTDQSEAGSHHDSDSVAFLLDLDQSSSRTDIQPRPPRLGAAEGQPLTERQESKINSCLTSLEKLLKDSQLSFDVGNILPQTSVIHEEEGADMQLLSRVGEGLFIVDEGIVDLLSLCSNRSDDLPVIRLSEGDFCGEYSTLFSVPFRTKIQFKSSVTLLHVPADVVRMNMHSPTGQLDREAMLNLSIVQSNLLSSELLGEDISSRVVAKCLKASLFSELSEDALHALADTLSPLLFSDGEIVYREGESASYIFLVLKGIVQLVTKDQPIRTHQVHYSSEGVCLAAKEFFGGSLLSHQAAASGPLLLASIGREQILDMLCKFPESAQEMKNIAQR